jgi:hypothetical protein
MGVKLDRWRLRAAHAISFLSAHGRFTIRDIRIADEI